MTFEVFEVDGKEDVFYMLKYSDFCSLKSLQNNHHLDVVNLMKFISFFRLVFDEEVLVTIVSTEMDLTTRA